MHTHTTLTKIYYESRDTCTRHIAGILCPCFKLCAAEDDRKKEKLLVILAKKRKEKKDSEHALKGLRVNKQTTKTHT